MPCQHASGEPSASCWRSAKQSRSCSYCSAHARMMSVTGTGKQYIHALCRPLMDLRVSVTGGVHFDLVKRVLRDIKRSGQAPEEIIQQVHFPPSLLLHTLPAGSR